MTDVYKKCPLVCIFPGLCLHKKAMRVRKKNPLNHTLAFRVSESDYQSIEKEAAASGIKKSELIRELLKISINGSNDQN